MSKLLGKPGIMYDYLFFIKLYNLFISLGEQYTNYDKEKELDNFYISKSGHKKINLSL